MNENEELNEREKLIYLAGIIDGEGTIGIQKAKSERSISYRYDLVIQITNTDKKLLNWLKENFNGSIRFQEKKDNHKLIGIWAIRNRQGFNFLKKVRPFLLIKKEQGNFAIEFYRECILKYNNYGKGRLPPWLNHKREKYFIRLKEMHH